METADTNRNKSVVRDAFCRTVCEIKIITTAPEDGGVLETPKAAIVRAATTLLVIREIGINVANGKKRMELVDKFVVE